MSLLLKNLLRYSNGDLKRDDIRIRRNLFSEIGQDLKPERSDQILNFHGHFIYPGLINAHDHLEMNLYPRLGHPLYQNYTEWGKDIYKPHVSPIKEVEKLSLSDRLFYGGLKNILNGVTTVVHHNPWRRMLSSSSYPVKVLRKMSWAHSLAFDPKAGEKYRRDNPYVIHAGEGIDEFASKEIDQLDEMGLLKSNTVIVHGVGITQRHIPVLQRNKVSLVWCPSSNYFMFEETTKIYSLKDKMRISLGTDSTLTGLSGMLEELRFAQSTGLASASELISMVTSIPASIFSLPEPIIEVGKTADFFIVPCSSEDYARNLIGSKCSDIRLVAVDGKLSVVDEAVASDLSLTKNFIHVEGRRKWTKWNVKRIRDRIWKQLRFKNILEKNPLWNLIEA